MKTSAPFTWDFALDGKAVAADGGLVVEGYAANFDLDRQNEAFLPGAFESALDRYLTTNPVVCYAHKLDRAMGQVLSAKLDGKGLFVKARIDEAEPNTEAADVYRKVESGTIRGFSVGGVFHRKQTPAGPRIHECDLREISIAPVPVSPESIYKLAGKAFGDDPDLDAILAQLEDVSGAFQRATAAL
jgi:HK97 family phage prohead protease